MANKKKARTSAKDIVRKIPRKTDAASIENETIKRVGRTIVTIENFLARWNAAKTKPDGMLPHVNRVRQFHEALLNWQKGALRSKGQSNEESRAERLREFVAICQNYS